MGIDVDNVQKLVRMEMGNISTSDLPDAVLLSKVQYALQDIGSRVGFTQNDYKLGQLTTVAGQQAYEIPKGQTIIDVYWSGADLPPQLAAELGQQFAKIPNSFLTPMSDYHRSDYVLDDLYRAQMERVYMTDIVDGKIYVSPKPTESGLYIVYSYYETTVDPESVDEQFEEAILCYAVSACCLAVAMRYRHYATPVRGDGLTPNQKTIEYQNQAEVYKARYEELMLKFS